MARDPYQLTEERILEPPRSWRGRLVHLGPGFILSASIVGSGELIATTTLGAKAGFVCLWVIIFSCLVKVTLQLEFGKHAIYSGKTSMSALDDMPGPRFGQGRWSVWTWLGIMSFKCLQVGGIVGGVGLILIEVFPVGTGTGREMGIAAWTVLSALLVSLLIFRGSYKPIERWCLVMIGLFTLVTMVSVIALQWTPNAITAAEFGSGLSLSIPSTAILLIAIGAFGITGVGGDEIIAYNYWLIEKGYAAHTGPRPDPSDEARHEAWLARARGWITVMKADALLSMVCYTLVTALFYLLGAAVLHRQGLVPTTSELVPTLAKMYTETLGPWARWIFLIGALVVLFSTLLAALAAWTRQFTDAFSHCGWGDFNDPARRTKFISVLAFLFPMIWSGLFFLFRALGETPATMVLLGGVLTAVLLLVVVMAAVIMRLKWRPRELRSGPLYDAALWLSSLAIVGVAVYSVWKVLG